MSHAALAFDTLQYAKRLKDGGFTQQQAETQAEAMKDQSYSMQDFIEDKIDNTLATKQDIKGLEVKMEGLAVEMKRLEVELKQDMKRLEVELKRLEVEIKQLGNNLLYKLGGMMVTGVVFLAAFITVLKFV